MMRATTIKDLPRRIVAMVREQNVGPAADVLMRPLGKARQVGTAGGDDHVVMGDHRHGLVDRNAGVTLRICQRVQIDLAHVLVPGREERLAQVSAASQRSRRAPHNLGT
jgi:hypothetical protein